MIRSRSLVFWGCLALCACGKRFEADSSGSAGDAGTGAASGGPAAGGAPSAGGAAVSAGADSGGDAGQPSVGAGAGNDGGSPGIGGLTGIGGGMDVDAGEVLPISTMGLALWLRADRGVTHAGGSVQLWLDQSGNRADALQTAVNLQPAFVANGFNGRPTLDFDGVGESLKLPTGFSDFSKGLSGFVVSKATDIACASTLELSNGTEIQDIEFGYWKGAWQYEVQDNDIYGGMIDTAKPELFALLHRPTGVVELRLNSVAAKPVSFALPEVVARQENFIGGTLYADCNSFKGQISEVILYDRIVTDKELLTIEAYLREHWGLPAP